MHDGLRLLISAEYGNAVTPQLMGQEWTRESTASAAPQEGKESPMGAATSD